MLVLIQIIPTLCGSKSSPLVEVLDYLRTNPERYEKLVQISDNEGVRLDPNNDCQACRVRNIFFAKLKILIQSILLIVEKIID